MRKLGFSLVELLVVIVIISIVTFLSVRFFYTQKKCENIYVYKNNRFVLDKNYTFQTKNGFYNSAIIKCNGRIFVIKPLFKKEVSTLKEAKEIFYNTSYAPKKGYY